MAMTERLDDGIPRLFTVLRILSPLTFSSTAVELPCRYVYATTRMEYSIWLAGYPLIGFVLFYRPGFHWLGLLSWQTLLVMFESGNTFERPTTNISIDGHERRATG